MRKFILFLVLSFLTQSPSIRAQSFPFVIPGDDSEKSITDRSQLLDEAWSESEFVKVKDGHFYVGDKRLRFWGMNVCFGANFPTHDEADKLAPHLAKLGINAVRFHHMDMQNAPNGLWSHVDKNGVRQFSKEMIDRLDYFLAKLHENKIYADINLHVSRTLTTEEGYPQAKDMPWFAAANKWVMYYDRDVQKEVKRFCEAMLLHKNPYRKNRRRVDDPGIGLVEMLNENYFSNKGYDLYRRMPERFQKSFIQRWNEWLVKKYENDKAVDASWAKDQPKMGKVLVSEATWKKEFEGWRIHAPNTGMTTKFNVPFDAGSGKNKAVRLEPIKLTPQDYSHQLAFPEITTTEGEFLTLSYWVRSDKKREYRAEFISSKDDRWRDLGLVETLHATEKWEKVERIINVKESIEKEVFLLFTVGQSLVPIEFAEIRLQQGALANQRPKSQSLTSMDIGIPEAGWPFAAHGDMKQFMIDTEIEWVKELKAFLQDDLEVKVPITASQANYHHPVINQHVNDFVDLHNYWHHPIFPSDAPWSQDRWTVGNDPMEADPGRAGWPRNSLLMRMGWGYEGKPMTLSEWNYPEPSPYSTGCVPMAAMLAALQDWDGIFFFDYDAFHRYDDKEESPYFRNSAHNHFSFNGQPVKLAAFSQFGNLFLRGDLKPLTDTKLSTPFEPIDGRLSLKHRLRTKLDAKPYKPKNIPDTADFSTPTKSVQWTSNPDKNLGAIQLNTKASRGVWGTIADSKYSVGGIKIETGSIKPNYGMVLLSSVDGQSLESTDKIILLSTSHSENKNMKWNEERTSVGKDWGTGPTQVTSFDAKIEWQTQAKWECYSLDGTGQRKKSIPVKYGNGSVIFDISRNDKTLWYELTRVQ